MIIGRPAQPAQPTALARRRLGCADLHLRRFVLGRSVGIVFGGGPNAFIPSLLIGEIAGLIVAVAPLMVQPANEM